MLKEPEAKTFAQGEAQVLILILMEHAQRVFNCWHDWARYSVLILILMEHAQRELCDCNDDIALFRLNPYFNGTCSKRPYNYEVIRVHEEVLILILMEHAQRVVLSRAKIDIIQEVLILILMEHAQRVGQKKAFIKKKFLCLNPYFNGTCSKRSVTVKQKIKLSCLNPYFNGTCSKSSKVVPSSMGMAS